MIDPEIRDQTYQFFLEEAPELLQIIEAGLLQFTQEPSSATIHDLMRAAHSIKGGAATVGLDAIKTIAHRLESIFRGLCCDTTEIDTELESLLLQAYDCLREPLEQQIREGNFDQELALATAEPILTRIEELLGDALKEADNYIPSSTDLGIDMLSSIFEVDVAQGIECLATVAANPQDYEVAKELQTQAEVFAGFAEILDLPGFGAIAKAVIDALAHHPEQALQILPLALADFQAAKEAVMAGDRTQGGSPSAALAAFSQNTQQEQIDEVRGVPGAYSPLGSDSTLPIAQAPQLTETPTVISLEDFEHLLPETETPTILEVPSEAVVISPNPELEEIETIETVTSLISSQSPQPSPQTTPENNQFVPKPSIEEQGSQKNRSSLPAQLGPTNNLKVRVDLNRLEKMNNLVGELVINRNSMTLRHEQLKRIGRKLQQRIDQLQQLISQFQTLSDQMIVAPINSELTPQPKSTLTEEVARLEQGQNQELTNFDSLEMDRYGNMHSSIQGVLEEMMQLEEVVEDVALLTRQSDRTIKHQQQTLSQLRDELMWARMLPLETVLNRFPRGLRDLSLKYQKPVNLKMKGTEVLVDKGMVEKLHDPLLHLLRNAFDHGIESPEIRREQGKPETGTIEISAAHRGNRTLIEVSDDGRGLDIEKIAQRALERGWLSLDQLARTTKEQLLDFIFEPGFSTKDRVSELSGRGVGLDVVRSQLQAVKGTVKVSSSPGEGTTFTLSLPLTLTVAKLLVCSVESTLVALPAASIEGVILPKTDQIKELGEQRVFSWREKLLPVYRLKDLLEYNYPVSVKPKSKICVALSEPEPGRVTVLIVRGEKQNFALEIEGCSEEQELVIKPLVGALAPPSYIDGCTVLGDGSLLPAIDAAALLAYVQEQKQAKIATQPSLTSSTTNTNQNSLTDTVKTVRVPTVLAVDDSTMMRRTLALTLQKVGYRVLQARDGWEAIELLQQNSQIELIVSDLEMPNLNGFEFLNQLRQDPRFSQIPVVMLTSRSNNKHRQLAMQLGASAYLSKPYIEQEFLAVLKTIMGQEQNIPSLPYAI
ncbi:MAG: response regulator [Xenococcaceae cyanobacterium MO_234.B1]|nr:response regulator [Xenococcaceae cyanobacterium MO_234.B1]